MELHKILEKHNYPIRMVVTLLLKDMYQNPTLYWTKVAFTKSHNWEVSKDSILIPNEYINGEMTTRKDFFHAIEAKLRKIITENYWNKVKTIS